MISLSEILHTIAQALMIPCLIILIILMAGAVWQIGDIVVEYIAERRKHKCNVPQLLRDVHAAGADGLAELIENSGLLRRQKKALLELAESRGLPKDTLTALAERLLATEEARNARTISITDMIAKLGPMFGLLGTLIPLGPGIVALGQGGDLRFDVFFIVFLLSFQAGRKTMPAFCARSTHLLGVALYPFVDL